MLDPAAIVSDTGPAAAGALQASWAGQLQLLILQPTPFCNLDCDYCYLPNRDDRSRMDFGVLEAVAWKVFKGRLPAPSFSVVWHAGEPLAVPSGWYARAFAVLDRHRPRGVEMVHHFQTNGVLIDSGWTDFFHEHGVRVGVSIDGPEWLHDRSRHTRDGKGTHAKVMRGVDALHTANVPFHVICVLTRESLDHPDEIFEFFSGLGTSRLCFNIEEIEAANARSSLAADAADTERAYRAFMRRILDRLRTAGAAPDRWRADSHSHGFGGMPGEGMRIREVDAVLSALRHPGFGKLHGNSQNVPGQIVSVAWDGRFSSFSPELLGLSAPGIGDLAMGNVLFDPLPPEPGDPRFLRQWQSIREGIDRCKSDCGYFNFCLGGAPSNKLGETGRFDSTETLFCRLTQKATADIVLEALDRDLPRTPASSRRRPGARTRGTAADEGPIAANQSFRRDLHGDRT